MPVISSQMRLLRLGRFAVVATGVALACPTPVSAQTITAPMLKAAFLYNLAKFAEWPPDVVVSGGPITLCVLGDAAVADILAESVKGHNIEQHAVIVSRITPEGPVRTCQLLYLSGLDPSHTVHVLESVTGAAVFTVSDLDRFAQMGGVAHLFMEGGRMRLAINLDAGQRARLHISSKLLALAKIVKDEARRGGQP
jgi:hypothetical protein